MESTVSEIIRLYVDDKLTLKEVSVLSGKAISTVRYYIRRADLLRSPKQAAILAGGLGRKGAHLAGKSKPLTAETIKKMTDRKREWADKNSKGFSLKPNGYFEITRGPNKSRPMHVVIMEQYLGRKILLHEVVHHIDHDRLNNDIANLQIMTRGEHARFHAMENLHNRERDQKGRFL